MFARLVWVSLMRRKRRRLAAILAIATGSGVATALIAMSAGFGARLAGELRAYGANILVTPAQETTTVEIGGRAVVPPADDATIDENQIPRLVSKKFFWHNNVLNFAPFLYARSKPASLVGTWFDRELPYAKGRYGVKHLNPWWRVRGSWPREDGTEALVGERAAAAMKVTPGDSIQVSTDRGTRSFRVAGIVSAGGPDDETLFVPLEAAQEMTGLKGRVKRVLVSALTTPDESIGKKFDFDPRELPPQEFERFSCTPSAHSIAYAIEKNLEFVAATPLRQVTTAEARVFTRLETTMALFAGAAVLISALGVMAVMSATILERRKEFCLLAAVGATRATIATQVVCETAAMAAVAGLAGAALGVGLGYGLGRAIFGAAFLPPAVVISVALGSSILIALLGIIQPLRHALRLEPAVELHEA